MKDNFILSHECNLIILLGKFTSKNFHKIQDFAPSNINNLGGMALNPFRNVLFRCLGTLAMAPILVVIFKNVHYSLKYPFAPINAHSLLITEIGLFTNRNY